MDDLDKILDSINLEEEKLEVEDEFVDDWYCMDCEHGPMTESDSHCTRCGVKNGNAHPEEEMTGWEEEDEMAGIEEIY